MKAIQCFLDTYKNGGDYSDAAANAVSTAWSVIDLCAKSANPADKAALFLGAGSHMLTIPVRQCLEDAQTALKQLVSANAAQVHLFYDIVSDSTDNITAEHEDIRLSDVTGALNAGCHSAQQFVSSLLQHYEADTPESEPAEQCAFCSQHPTVVKQEADNGTTVQAFVGREKLNFKFGNANNDIARIAVKYCPFCGKKL